jgi:hypothetical protein
MDTSKEEILAWLVQTEALLLLYYSAYCLLWTYFTYDS